MSSDKRSGVEGADAGMTDFRVVLITSFAVGVAVFVLERTIFPPLHPWERIGRDMGYALLSFILLPAYYFGGHGLVRLAKMLLRVQPRRKREDC